jgi:hypothetical protein
MTELIRRLEALRPTDRPGRYMDQEDWERQGADTMLDRVLEVVKAYDLEHKQGLDPEPWVIHSIDSGTIRFAKEDDCWAGYRTHFEPRDGYSKVLEDYL